MRRPLHIRPELAMAMLDTVRPEEDSLFATLGSRLGTVGVLTIVCGAIALVRPDAATFVINYLVGALTILFGVTQIAGSRFRVERRWLAVVAGVLYVAAGVVLFMHPLVGIVSMTILLAWMLILSGAFRVAAALSGEIQFHRGLAGLSGLSSLILGWVVLRYLPDVSLWTVGMFVGIDMLFAGFAMFGVARRLKSLAPPAGRPPTGTLI